MEGGGLFEGGGLLEVLRYFSSGAVQRACQCVKDHAYNLYLYRWLFTFAARMNGFILADEKGGESDLLTNYAEELRDGVR